jgi:hypothetical protein
MEVLQLLISDLPDSTIGLLGALAVYLIISVKRNSTKAERDEEYKLLKYRMTQVENQTVKLTEKLESVVEILNKIHVEMAKMNKDK